MNFSRSKSLLLKPKTHSSIKQQSSKERKMSLSNLRSRQKQNQHLSMKLFKQRIVNYIQKRSDVQIVKFFDEYKEQFYRKSVNLQNLLFKQPDIQAKHLSQQNPHFYKGFEQTLINLFRKRVLVPAQFRNLRARTVEQIQKWIFSWIRRQRIYEKVRQEQQTTVAETIQLLQEIKSFNQNIQSEKPLF